MAISFNRRKIVLGMGLFYSAIGALGLVTGLSASTADAGQSSLFGLLGSSQPLGLIHLGVGLIAIWASQSGANPRQLLTGLTAVFGLLVGAAFVPPVAQVLALTGADTIVHLASLLLVGYVGLVEPETAAA
jgi:hypothetical protein